MSASAPPAARPGAPVKGKGKGPPPPKALALPLGKGAGKAGKVPVPYTGPKLRPLFWQTTSQVPANSVWTDLRPPARFDESLLEKQFALSQPRSATPANAGDTSARRAASSNDESRKRLRILDEKSSHFLAIAFNRLPPPEALGQVLQSLEEFPECLHPEAVLALHNAAGEQQEAVEQIRQLDVPASDLAQLGEAERYLWVLSAVPLCSAKLACGALLIAHTKDLSDISVACERVASCCEVLKSSDLIKRTVSTSLAVGNVLNRGTARSEARAVTLPEGLLKFEELRGSAQESEESEGGEGGSRGPTLLDFVARAIVEEDALVWASQTLRAFPSAVASLKEQTAALRSTALLASKADLDEAENLCKKVTEAATKAASLSPQIIAAAGSATAAAEGLAARVQTLFAECQEVSNKLQRTKEVLKETQAWCSTRASTKGSEWFASWATFFDQLSTAFGRARPISTLAALPPPQGVSATSAGASMSATHSASSTTAAAAPAPTAATTAAAAAPPAVASAGAPSTASTTPASAAAPATTKASTVTATAASNNNSINNSNSNNDTTSNSSNAPASCAANAGMGALQSATVGVGIGLMGTTSVVGNSNNNGNSNGNNNNNNNNGSKTTTAPPSTSTSTALNQKSGSNSTSNSNLNSKPNPNSATLPLASSTIAQPRPVAEPGRGVLRDLPILGGNTRSAEPSAKASKAHTSSRAPGVKLDDDARLDRNALSMLLATPTPQTASNTSGKEGSNSQGKTSSSNSSSKQANNNNNSSNSSNSSSISNVAPRSSEKAAAAGSAAVSTGSRLELFRPNFIFGRSKADKENRGQ